MYSSFLIKSFLINIFLLTFIEFNRFKPGEFYSTIYHKPNTIVEIFNNGYWHDRYNQYWLVNHTDYVNDYTMYENTFSRETRDQFVKSLTLAGFERTGIHQCDSFVYCNGFVTGELFDSIVYYVRWTLIPFVKYRV